MSLWVLITGAIIRGRTVGGKREGLLWRLRIASKEVDKEAEQIAEMAKVDFWNIEKDWRKPWRTTAYKIAIAAGDDNLNGRNGRP